MRPSALLVAFLGLATRSHAILEWNDYSDRECQKDRSFRPVSEMWPDSAFNCQNIGEGFKSFRIADDENFLENHTCELEVFTHMNCGKHDRLQTYSNITGNTCVVLPEPESGGKWVSPFGARSSRFTCKKAPKVSHWEVLVPTETESPRWITMTKFKTVEFASVVGAATTKTDTLTDTVTETAKWTTLGTIMKSPGVHYSIVTTVLPASTVVVEDGVPVSTLAFPGAFTTTTYTSTDTVTDRPKWTTLGTVTRAHGVDYSIGTTLIPASTLVLENGVPVSTIEAEEERAEETDTEDGQAVATSI